MAAPESPDVTMTTMSDKSDKKFLFQNKERRYFTDILSRKWECSDPAHTVCVVMRDGRHRQLSAQDLEDWMKELRTGKAATDKPPVGILKGTYINASTSSGRGFLDPRPVSVPPSREHVRRRAGGSVSSSSRDDRSQMSTSSSGVPGVGYYGGKALKWLGEKSIHAMEEVVIRTRAESYLSTLRQWQRPDDLERITDTLTEKRTTVFSLLEVALELSRPCYPFRINKLAYSMGREVQLWLKLLPSGPFTPKTASWLALIQICLLPLLLARISRKDPRAADLSYDILDVLFRMPLNLHDCNSISPAIKIVIRELTYSPYTAECSQHSWLGVDLRSTIATLLQARPLTDEELSGVRDMSERRVAQDDACIPGTCRPWEVAIVADCAKQDPSFKDFVLGPHGVDTVLSSLRNMTDEHRNDGNMTWEPLSLIVRSLAFLSQHPWVTHLVTPEVNLLLLKITRLRVPEKWFCIRFWAMDTIRNVVWHHPSTLYDLPVEEARTAFQAMLSASTKPTSILATQLHADYQKEADDCATYLLERMTRRIENLRRGIQDTLTVQTRDIPPRLSLSGPSEESTSPLEPFKFSWESETVFSGSTRHSTETVFADDRSIASAKLPAIELSSSERPHLVVSPIAAPRVAFTVESGFGMDETSMPWNSGPP